MVGTRGKAYIKLKIVNENCTGVLFKLEIEQHVLDTNAG